MNRIKRGSWAKLLALVPILFFVAACREEILHELDELKANQVQLVLKRKGIDSRKSKASGGLWNIDVPSTQVLNSLSELERSRVVLRDLARFKGFDLNLLSSREERRQASEQKSAWSIEQTLEKISGVLEARVHLELPLESDPPQKLKPGSASVLLVVDEKLELEESKLKTLIAGAAGISAESIGLFLSRERSREQPQVTGINSEHPLDAISLTAVSEKQTPTQASTFSLSSDMRYFLLSVFGCLASGGFLFSRGRRKKLELSNLKLIGEK